MKWEKKVELIFYYHNYFEEKKLKLIVIEFTKKSVEGYHKKIEIFMIRADIMEVTEAKMTRFLNGLNK